MEVLRLIDEDFQAFHIGYFPSDISAVGEYHFRQPEGHTGIWYEPNKDTSWISKKCWMIREHGGEHELEQEIETDNLPWGNDTIPMLVAGEREWSDYILAGKVWALSHGKLVGLAFRYVDSRHFYLFALSHGRIAALYKKHEDELIPLKEAAFTYDCDQFHRLEIKVESGKFECSVDGVLVLSAADFSYPAGKIALVACTPARFASITLDMNAEDHATAQETRREALAKAENKRAGYPALVLWKVLDLKNSGAAKNIRYGDLTGEGKKSFLFIQSMPCLNSDDESMISCITAVGLDGEVLWQTGEPDSENGVLCGDLPVQVYDIDGDGFCEVIYCKDFNLIVADGKTGKTKYSARTPGSVQLDRFTIYQNTTFYRIAGDSIRICNFSGKSRPSDILLKDRYNNIWVYDKDLQPLWHKSLNTGHFPYSFDFNGDGMDELIAGSSMLSGKGELLWQISGLICHVDEIAAGRFDPANDKLIIAMAAGEDGFLLVDQDGKLLLQDKLGHAQRLSVANYRQELPGMEYCVSTFWRNTGIIVLYDCRGNRLFSTEPGANGNVVCPVNWTGDGRELILYSASTSFGGLYDGYGDRMVAFPEDGHPDLCCDAVDVFGDEREELLVWDTGRMFIYTQADNPKEVRYIPEKQPNYNYSNYSGQYSYPKWKTDKQEK